MDYRFEQRGRRPVVAIAAFLGLCMTGVGLAYGAPWYFTAIVGLPALMATVVFWQDSHSGLHLEGDTLTLFKDEWRKVIDVSTIQGVRVTTWSDGQPCIWLDVDQAPAYRLPGYCFGSAEPLKAAFRQRGIAVA